MRGGYGSSGHGSLHDRIHGPTPATPPTTPPSPARHCLVDGAPSLLVEWRQGERAWEGRVVSVLWLDGQGWATVERWLPASAITRPG
ncbi:hypothetical protein FB382_000845 [Nocardioides ginsengisegetis]|uniref:Uncharacterized protein n=1 Tax=Nocardioides ginsengisegetis TaxID=661491 RepID=A0A7W3IXZ9_9ACTN|nr:hypothetical protein [Nocardioides ginsengisegetis]MBA8802554.1 hypothetical protein [Nocardioides ginsengisegetis]